MTIAPETVGHSVPLPGVFAHPADMPVALAQTLSPSDLGGAKALPGDMGLDEEAAKLRGLRIHLLLEHLPELDQSDWSAATRRILADTPIPEQEMLLSEARGVLLNQDLSLVFSQDALSEVALTAPLGNTRIHGIIDRLIVSPDSVLAVDFKTNATVPASPNVCPEGLLRQMGAYAQALAGIYPGKRIETAILWTRTSNLMPLSHDLVTDALLRSPRLDGSGKRS